MKKKVLILGAGYGGVFAAAWLSKEKKYFDIILVDKNPRLELLQQIPSIILGSKEPEDATVAISSLFKKQIDAEGGMEFVQALVESIDLNGRIVKASMRGNEKGDIQDRREFKYDYLVIALGSETIFFGIQGAKENALPFRSVHDALQIRERVAMLDDSSTIIIGGGGPTGVSLAAALAESKFLQGKQLRIRIVEAGETVLSGWDERLAKAAEAVLLSRGIEILPGRKIQEITPGSVIMESGDELNSDCTIWTAGVKGQTVKITPEIEKMKSDTIPVDSHFNLRGFDNAFAIGDICEFKARESLPKLSQLAVRHARFVAANIVRREKRESMDSDFKFSQRGHTLSLGHESLALLNGLLVTNNMCNYTEDTIIDNFVTEIKNRGRGISVKAHAAAKDVKGGEHPAAFDFVTYATSDAFSELVK